jgi:hypothetical protein
VTSFPLLLIKTTPLGSSVFPGFTYSLKNEEHKAGTLGNLKMEEGNTKRARIPTNFFVQQNSKERELETLKKSADRPKKKVPSCISHVFLASELERRI